MNKNMLELKAVVNVIYYTKNDDNILYKKYVDGKRLTIADGQALMDSLIPDSKPMVLKTLVEDIEIGITEEQLKEIIL